MGKLRKILLIFTAILIQSALAVTAGMAAIAYAAGDTLPPGIYAGNANIGGLGKLEASKAIDDYYDAILTKDTLNISISDNSYSIPYSEFDAHVDGPSTVALVENWRSKAFIPGMIRAYFGHESFNIHPVIKYNEGKLRQKLIELSKEFDKAPVNASIAVEDGVVVKKAETPGYELDIAAAADAIGVHLKSAFGSPLIIDGKGSEVIRTVNAEFKLKEISDIEHIISEYSTEIMEPELLSSIRLAAGAINGIILDGTGKAEGVNGTEFSFIKVLNNFDESFQNDNEGYDQVASTLYAALLSAGIGKYAITRLPHKLAVEYIEPGLDAWISGNGGDLKFRNTLQHKIALFASVEDNRLTISLAGSLSDIGQPYSLRTEVVQKFSPPVVNTENKELKPGEKIMLSPGKEGLLVQVFRNDELISKDRYEPEKSMFQVGPGTDWSSEENK